LNATNTQKLEIVAEGLGDILDQFVFVGGATVEFYATATGAPKSRPTLDVDCIIEISSYSSYGDFEDVLRQKGFRNEQSEGAPLCRWTYEGIKIDVMPTDTNIIGFSNRWYAEGIRHSMDVELPGGRRIRVLKSPYFLAAKLEAVKTRGWADLRTSIDFEDVVYVLRNRSSFLTEVLEAEPGVREYLRETLRQMLARNDINEALVAVLDFGEPEGTALLIRGLMEDICRAEENPNNA
jgi:hypothetical protein